MSYDILANSRTPALVIYVLDVSGSMSANLDGQRRIDVVMNSLQAALQQMVFRSTKGSRVAPRYRVAIFAYSDTVYDILGGVKTIDQVAQLGVPVLDVQRRTDTAAAFTEVEKLLIRELPNIDNCPAPLVCHMTDGEFTGSNPEPIVRRIMNMKNSDGKVLVENIFISDKLLSQRIADPRAWPGVVPSTALANEYANTLRSISSPLPESYQIMMLESGYQMSKEAVMMIPGMNQDLVELGFVMSSSTPTTQ
jgi:hypothetical protein